MVLREQTEAAEAALLSPYACLSARSKGRQIPLEPCPTRTCFQRDIDRIVHSKAFRRLKHKTQVFLEPEGDHYRTRMTHTIEVSRIARTIARGLRLNEDLAEAAAYGHDLGHTPFGHAGERVLNEIMPGGFAHNQQSLRVVDRLERDGEGLNLTYEVRRGILCHTGPDQAETLEGRLLRLADKIAYINHDIDDAMRGKIIYPMDLPLSVSQVLGFTHSERINTLTVDIITQSAGKNDIVQSPACRDAMHELREFMFEYVYRSPVAKGEEGKAQDMIRRLFEYYVKDPDKLPPEYQDIRVEEGVERAVCDYISGMTDKYAVERFGESLVPGALRSVYSSAEGKESQTPVRGGRGALDSSRIRRMEECGNLRDRLCGCPGCKMDIARHYDGRPSRSLERGHGMVPQRNEKSEEECRIGDFRCDLELHRRDTSGWFLVCFRQRAEYSQGRRKAHRDCREASRWRRNPRLELPARGWGDCVDGYLEELESEVRIPASSIPAVSGCEDCACRGPAGL